MRNKIIGEIIKTEIRSQFLNSRFMMAIILTSVCMIASIFFLSREYDNYLDNYRSQVSLQDNFLDRYAHVNRLGGLFRVLKQPADLFVLSGDPLGSQDSSGRSGSESLRTMRIGFDSDPSAGFFVPITFIFITSVIFSLIAVLFAHDGITGERENGRLKIIMANSMSRSVELSGKFLGGIIGLLVPYLFALLIGLILIQVFGQVRWSASDWGAVVLLVVSSAVYLSIFHALGLWLSAACSRSETSVLFSLLFWVMLVLVIPNLTPFLAARLVEVPSATAVQRQVRRMGDSERDDIGRTFYHRAQGALRSEYGQAYDGMKQMNREQIARRIKTDPSFAQMYKADTDSMNRAWGRANEIQNEKIKDIMDEFAGKSRRQSDLAYNLALISPYTAYLYGSLDLSAVGFDAEEHFQRAGGEYMKRFWEFTGVRYKEAMAADPTFDSNSFLDLSGRPRFVYRELSLADRLSAVLPLLGILAAFLILFLTAAYVAFIRYDVR
ncbi:ABC transporter permease [candidate division KSB1 bacterium]